MRNLIFVSMENWDNIWRRNQFVCAHLLRRYPGIRILFVGLPNDASNQLRHGQLTGLIRDHTYSPENFPRITVTHPLKLLPNTLDSGRRFNERIFRGHVEKLAAKLGFNHPLLWLNPHSAEHMVGRMGECAVIYDITDDWTTLTQAPRTRQLVAAQDAALCAKANAVIVCSSRLRDLKASMAGDRLHLVPNGVDCEHYSAVSQAYEAGSAGVAEAAHWRRPVLGYTGSIHPDRVDVKLIAEVARKMPEATVVLVGPNQLPAKDAETLRACGNVQLLGPVAYQRIPELMRAFDVCITPHVITPFTESLNPIKLFEYLAGGKPIVSTNVAGFRNYPALVRIAHGAEEFVAACRSAAAEGTTFSTRRREEAMRHSWHDRVDAIAAIMESVAGDDVAIEHQGRRETVVERSPVAQPVTELEQV